MAGEYPRVDCIVCGRNVATPTQKGGLYPRHHLPTKRLRRAVALYYAEVHGLSIPKGEMLWCPYPHESKKWGEWWANNKRALVVK